MKSFRKQIVKPLQCVQLRRRKHKHRERRVISKNYDIDVDDSLLPTTTDVILEEGEGDDLVVSGVSVSAAAAALEEANARIAQLEIELKDARKHVCDDDEVMTLKAKLKEKDEAVDALLLRVYELQAFSELDEDDVASLKAKLQSETQRIRGRRRRGGRRRRRSTSS